MNDMSKVPSVPKFVRVNPIKTALEHGIKHLKKSGGNAALVTGVTGAGKTSIITSGFGTGTDVREIKSTDQVEEILGTIANAGYYVFIDTPGDPAREEVLESGVAKYITGGVVSGIVNVVSCGYNIPADRPDEPIPNASAIIEKQREDINYIKTLFDMAVEPKSIKWFLTVVNKSDLWGNDASVSDRLYGFNSNYGSIVRNALPSANIELVSCSIRSENLAELSDKLSRLVKV